MKRTWVGMLVLAACAETPLPEETFSPLETAKTLWVATRQGKTGELVQVDLGRGKVSAHKEPISGDAVVRSFSEDPSSLFVLNRFGSDNVQRISRKSLKTATQYRTGTATNIQDMVWVDSQTAWISQQMTPEIRVVHPRTGEGGGSWTLPQDVWDADGNPDAGWMLNTPRGVWISLRWLEGPPYYPARSTARAVLVDTQSHEILETWQFPVGNPVTELKLYDTRLCAGLCGTLGKQPPVLDGGILCRDTGTGQEDWLVREQDLGGDLLDFEVLDASRAVALVSAEVMRLVFFEYPQFRVIQTHAGGKGFSLAQVRTVDDFLVVVESDETQPGLRIWDKATLKPLRWIPLKLPPYFMDVTEG